MKKIGILTQPLHDNYGGLLQAYALSQVLIKLGYDPMIINRRAGHSNALRKLAFELKQMIFPNKYTKYKLSSSEKNIISKYTTKFREELIPNLTEEIIGTKKLKQVTENGYSGFVVGSDQCWRPGYSPNITNYFLDFAEDRKEIKRISYAASFGTSDWEFNESQTKRCGDLLKKFDFVSVREDSGIDLCKKHFGSDAVHVLDPTMLFSRDFYDEVTLKSKIDPSNGNLKAYVLDKSKEKYEIINHIAKKMDLKTFEVMPNKRLGKEKPENIRDFQFPSPYSWLRGYYDAKFVVADSFHGTVFAILYNIPFIAIANKSRGMARFNSLLKMFNLQNRLLTDLSIDKVNEILENQIDWTSVNQILERERERSINFLKESLA